MFDKLEDLVKRLDEVMQELSEPDVVSDQNRFRNLMKEQNELAPIVEKYKEYKEAKQTIEDSVEMLEEEHDEEMRELLKEELSEAKKNVEQYEEELKVLLLPKDPNDDKNVIVEIRGGAGGDEAALFAPAPPLISTITFFSSLGSLGNKRIFNSASNGST